MNMNMKASTKKMKGFMCQSPAATAVVCMTGDHQSVIVPRRPDRTLVDHHHARLMKNTKYIRLGDRRRNNPNIAPAAAAAASKMIRSTGHNNNNNTIPSLRRKSTTTGCEDDHKKQIQNIPQLASSNPRFEVVVMRVSLHCQGCAGKLKKHLSKMEGVTSFSIDLETKRVTVMGHVSPVSVLENISKVRRAEFWPC